VEEVVDLIGLKRRYIKLLAPLHFFFVSVKKFNMTDREESVAMAQLADQAERYEDMVEYMKKVAHNQQELSVEERNLLSVAYKNVIGSRRSSWRILSSILQKQNETAYATHAQTLQKKIEEELTTLCNDVLNLLDQQLLPHSSGEESKVFFNKMKGDYHRYMAEYSTGEAREAAASKAAEAYKVAEDIATEHIATTHPLRLGLALNYSVFLYEIANTPEKACSVAKQAFDNAISELDSLTEESYRDSTLIMQLLRDNLTLWTSDIAGDDDADDDDDD